MRVLFGVLALQHPSRCSPVVGGGFHDDALEPEAREGLGFLDVAKEGDVLLLPGFAVSHPGEESLLADADGATSVDDRRAPLDEVDDVPVPLRVE